jgi:hypothetical protein
VVTILYAYVAYSTFYVFGMSSLTIKDIARYIIVSFCIYMLYRAFFLWKGNVKGLYKSYVRLDNTSQDDIRREYIKKIVLYSLFSLIVILYYLTHIAKEVYCLFVHLKDRKEYELLGLEAVECWILYFIIVCLFHPCLFTRNFRIALIYNKHVSCF